MYTSLFNKIMHQQKKMFVTIIIYSICLMELTLSETASEQDPSKSPSNTDGGLTSESEVLGPFRIWHLVFIICTVLTVVMVVVCCCFDFRIPRTRQEIEESYQKRQTNAKYLKYLEKLPTGFEQNNKKLAEAEGNRGSQPGLTHVDSVQQNTKAVDRKKHRGDRIAVAQTEDRQTNSHQEQKKQRRIAVQENNGPIGAAGVISKKRQIGESRPRPSTVAMNKSLYSLPRGNEDLTRY